MTAQHPLPTREAVLAHGFPEGLIDRHRQQAHATRARAMGTALAALAHGMRRLLSTARAGVAAELSLDSR